MANRSAIQFSILNKKLHQNTLPSKLIIPLWNALHNSINFAESSVRDALFYRFLFAVGDDFSLSVTRVGDGTPHLGSGAQLKTNERRRRLTLTTALI